MARREGRTDGSAAILGLLVAFVIWIGVLAALYETSLDWQERAVPLEADTENDGPVMGLGDSLISMPGEGWYMEGGACDGAAPTPESVTRFGLGGEPCGTAAPGTTSNELGYDKLRSLHKSALEADPANGAVDYEEARASLGLEGVDFHLRTRVILPTIEELLSRPSLANPNLHPLYIGNYLDPPGKPKPGPEDSVAPEVAFVDRLVVDFDPLVADPESASVGVPYGAEGDIFPDLKSFIDANLAGRLQDSSGRATLASYNTLIVGTGIDQTALNGAGAKKAVEGWVTAGGYLILLGGDADPVQWIQPFLHASIQGGSGDLEIAEPDDQLLNHPNELRVQGYEDLDLIWRVNTDHADRFEEIVLRDGFSLVKSREGTYGFGRIVLSSFRPYDADGTGSTGPCDPAGLQESCEGLRFMQNLLGLGYDSITVDFGPPVPADRPVSGTVRIATVHHRIFGDHVELEVTLHLW